MFEYIKAKIRLFITKETQEMRDAKRQGECILALANVIKTDQHDPWSHLAKVTTAMEQLSQGGNPVSFELTDDTCICVRFDDKCIAVVMAKENIHIFPVIEKMSEWVSLHRRSLLKN